MKQTIRQAINDFFSEHPLGKVSFSPNHENDITINDKYVNHGVLAIEGEEKELYKFLTTYKIEHYLDNFSLRYDGGYFLTTL